MLVVSASPVGTAVGATNCGERDGGSNTGCGGLMGGRWVVGVGRTRSVGRTVGGFRPVGRLDGFNRSVGWVGG